MKSRVLMVVCFLLVYHSTFAASFDCEKAKSKIEKAICGDKELSLIDEALAKTYGDARSRLGETDKAYLKNAQLNWIKSLRTTCAAESTNTDDPQFVACLKMTYKYRMEELAGTGTLTQSVPTSVKDDITTKVGPRCHDISVTGIKSKGAFFKFLDTLKSIISAKDSDAINKLVIFPLRVNANPNKVIKTPIELKQNFSFVFNEKIVKAITFQKPEEIFCNYQGAMIGNGEVWISQSGDKVGIYVINISPR
jgi:uncharacterized protein